MGVTQTDIPILETLIKNYDIKSVIELGAQQNYAQQNLPAPYMSEWWERKGIRYWSIDLSGENNALIMDLSARFDFAGKVLYGIQREYDIVTDFGTSEHIGSVGKFYWPAIYNCWINKFNLCKLNGHIISENPKTGNWPLHGFSYYTKEFYRQLEAVSDLGIILLDEVPAMGNKIDGWNILAIMVKTGNKFPTLEEFMQLDLRQS